MQANKNIVIQGKTQYRLNEVCSITGVKPYVLRFWESEFSEIKPVQSPNGEKVYLQNDLDVIALIKKLLFKDKMTIEKAKFELSLHSLGQSSTHVPDKQNEEDPSADAIEYGHDQFQLVCDKLKSIILKSETIEKNHNWFQI